MKLINLYIIANTTTKTVERIVNKVKCDKGISGMISDYWGLFVIFVPILLIVMMTVDFLKAMSSSDSEAIKKSSTNAIKRVIAAVILLALPWLLRTIFTVFGLQEYLCF